MNKNKLTILFLLILLTAILSGCGPDETIPAPIITSTVPSAEIPEASPTNTPTPIPTAVIAYVATVNGEGIRQTGFEASLRQLTLALQTYPEILSPGQSPEERVLDELVNRALLAQAAREAGYHAELQTVLDRLAVLVEQAGGEEAFNAWLLEYGFSMETFVLELPLEMEAAWQRDQIAAAVPERMEQVRARQVLFYDPFQASRAYEQLKVGIPFDWIVENNDSKNLGYLDWFPRGYLLFPELEEIAFSLQPGQHSAVIETLAGYHILQVLEIDPNHPLSTDARLTLQEQAVAEWLISQRANSQVEIFLP